MDEVQRGRAGRQAGAGEEAGVGPQRREPGAPAERELAPPGRTPQRGPARCDSMVRLLSGDYFGMEGRIVEVQVDVSSRGQPGFHLVGLVGRSTRESRERVRSAITNSGFRFPFKDRIVVNLAPATQEKRGAGFDLAIALGILIASGQVPRLAWTRNGAGLVEELGIVGELGLQGEVRPTRGVLLAAHALEVAGARALMVAVENAAEGSLVPRLEVYPARDIHDGVAALEGALQSLVRRPPSPRRARPALGLQARAEPDFLDVRGQEAAKRALLVAAAGHHNVLLTGAPGVGKTMLARRLPGILPPLEPTEALELSRIQSVTATRSADGLVDERPFRAPHHTISYAGMVGGGAQVHPGEVTRAHGGVLFLDEAAEFERRTLEALREPLEEGLIHVTRTSGSATYPARFLLVLATNPCPCGYLGHPRRACLCTPGAIASYRQRLSGPLLDRLDLHCDLRPMDPRDLSEAAPRDGLASREMSALVEEARARQSRRWGPGAANGGVALSPLLEHGGIQRAALEALQGAAERLCLSARAWTRILRVARTIADLEGQGEVACAHVYEALQFRERG